MEHTILFVQVLIIISIAGALTVALLNTRYDKDGFFKNMAVFFGVLLLSAFFNLILYYNFMIFSLSISDETSIAIWELLVCIFAFFWIRFVGNRIGDREGRIVKKSGIVFFCCYFAVWLISIEGTGQIVFAAQALLSIVIALAILLCGILAHKEWSQNGNKSKQRYFVAVGSIVFFCEFVLSCIVDEKSRFMDMIDPISWMIVSCLFIVFMASAYSEGEKVISEPVILENAGDAYSATNSIEEKLKLVSERYELTSRETEILGMILAGKSNQEISDELYISLPTVKKHIHNCFTKMGASNRVDAILLVNEK